MSVTSGYFSECDYWSRVTGEFASSKLQNDSTDICCRSVCEELVVGFLLPLISAFFLCLSVKWLLKTSGKCFSLTVDFDQTGTVLHSERKLSHFLPEHICNYHLLQGGRVDFSLCKMR